MQKEHKEILSKIFCNMLEKLTFMFGELVERDELLPQGVDYVQASMTFSGKMSGALSLTVPSFMCTKIAANVLGMEVDDELVMARGTDALREVLNVTCGNVLTAIAGQEPIFNLTVPTISNVNPDAWETLSNDSNTMCFLVDDTPVLLNLALG